MLSTDFGPVCDFWQSSSSRMHVIYHNWSATKQRPHLQSVAEISRHSVLSGGTGFDNVRHRLGLATRTQISVCKSLFPSAGTAVSLFRAKTVQQRPLLPREVETWLPYCGVTQWPQWMSYKLNYRSVSGSAWTVCLLSCHHAAPIHLQYTYISSFWPTDS